MELEVKNHFDMYVRESEGKAILGEFIVSSWCQM